MRTDSEITPLPPAPLAEPTVCAPPPSGEVAYEPPGTVRRMLVPWDQLREGDVVVCCDGTPWIHPRTVISAVADDHNTDHFWLRTLERNEEVPEGGAIYQMRFMWLVERRNEATGLEEHAERELRFAGMFDDDSDYGGMLGRAVLELVRAFAGKGHSGGSAQIALALFDRLARWKPLTPITCKPEEWMDVAEIVVDQKPATLWQSRRDPALFSVDGGKHYYSVDEGAETSGGVTMMIEGRERVMYAAFDPAAPPINLEQTSATSVVDAQPVPVANTSRPTWERVIEMCERWASCHPIDQVVIADMRARDELGRKRYGTPLQPGNGRDSLTDLYQEQLDAIVYNANVIIERGEELDTMNTQLGEMLWRTIASASAVRQLIMERAGEDPFARNPDGTIDDERRTPRPA